MDSVSENTSGSAIEPNNSSLSSLLMRLCRLRRCSIRATNLMGLVLLWATLSTQPAFTQGSSLGPSSFVNWESPHVHPLELTPDGLTLLAVNTPDNRLEVFDVTAEGLALRASIPVGLEPVSVRSRTNSEAWVVNHLSDSVSVVDLESLNVVDTLETANEPADVIFGGTPQRAFVSCSQANEIWVFDPSVPEQVPEVLVVAGEDPRALAVSLDGQEVYVAIFESGNGTTLVGGGLGPEAGISYPPNAVSHPDGPYGGVNPPPNTAAEFDPMLNPENPPPPGVSLIVRRSPAGRWRDDNGEDWTDLVSGTKAVLSGRVEGWGLIDHDLAIIDTTTLEIRYVGGLMNACMTLAVNPRLGRVSVVGTDATNEVRFEPNLQSRFIRVRSALVDPSLTSALSAQDLNPHLDYTVSSLPEEEKQLALGDPRGIAWHPEGTKAWVTGMGSSNLVSIDPEIGGRMSDEPPIPVGEGPTGVVYDGDRDRLYVLNRFEASISVVDPVAAEETSREEFFDPTPTAILEGRPLLYDTHQTSGLGQASCASCHIDARIDRLAWDLGDPAGSVRSLANRNLGMGLPPLIDAFFAPYHPMKGPMLTQTLQDIIGKEPHHWRGDQDGIEGFSGTYASLLGRDTEGSEEEMEKLKHFLASLHFPPNPFRLLDNSLPTDLPLPRQYSDGSFAPVGDPLPNGNARRGLDIFRRAPADGLACSSCHTLTTGMSPDRVLTLDGYQRIPLGPNGERHHGIVALKDVGAGVTKAAQLRNLYERVGCEATQTTSGAGFGYNHDGSFDSLSRFVSEPSFGLKNIQEAADLVAFLLSFSGSDLPSKFDFPREAPGTPSRDAHAAVGKQLTLAQEPLPDEQQQLNLLVGLAEAGEIGLIAKGLADGLQRGYVYLGNGRFQSDRLLEQPTAQELKAGTAPGAELTLTAVPIGTETRMGIDRDEDGVFDRDEIDQGSRPDDASSRSPLPATFVPSPSKRKS